MVRLFMLMFVLGLVLTVVALISCLSAEPDEVRAMPRLAWAFVIIVLPVVGALLYLSSGRPLPDGAAGAGPGGAGGVSSGGRSWRTATGLSTRPQKILAPDDDPEFLTTIDTGTRAADEAMLRQWEEEFRTPTDEPGKKDKPIDDSPASDG